MSTGEYNRLQPEHQTLDSLFEMSQLLNTGLNKATLATCVGMIEHGVNPEGLAAVIQDLRRECSAMKHGHLPALEATSQC